jgi:hypothetical protein
VDVSPLYFDGCPNWQETEQRLRTAWSAPAVAMATQVAVGAQRLQLRGSDQR